MVLWLNNLNFFEQRKNQRESLANKNYDLLLLNCQAITANKCDILYTDILQEYGKIKFLCLTETCCTVTNVEAVHIQGYKLAASFSRKNCKGGGVGIWCATDLSVNALNLNLSEHCVEKHFEICGISWSFEEKKIFLFTSYRSPDSDIQIFYNNIGIILDLYFKRNNYFILAVTLILIQNAIKNNLST